MNPVLKDLVPRQVNPPGQAKACGVGGTEAGVEVGVS